MYQICCFGLDENKNFKIELQKSFLFNKSEDKSENDRFFAEIKLRNYNGLHSGFQRSEVDVGEVHCLKTFENCNFLRFRSYFVKLYPI